MKNLEERQARNMKEKINLKSKTIRLKELKKSSKGITLIALVITIIVLLILAGVSIALLTGDNGILTQANEAKKANKHATLQEDINLIANQIRIEHQTGNLDSEKFKNELEKQYKGYNLEVTPTLNKYILDFKDKKYLYRENGTLEEYTESYMETGKNFQEQYSEYKEKIIKVDIVKSMKIPENAIQIIDVSRDKNKTIMAWLEPNGEMYNMYISSASSIIAHEYCNAMFSDFTNVNEINFMNFDTYKTISMYSMFYNTPNLVELDLTNFDISKVTNMSCMFMDCGAKEIILLSSNNIVTEIGQMFQGSKAEKIVLSGIDTSNVTNMSCTFHACENLRYLDISNFNFDSVTIFDHFISWLSRKDAIVYVKDEKAQKWVLDKNSNWSTDNVIIKKAI